MEFNAFLHVMEVKASQRTFQYSYEMKVEEWKNSYSLYNHQKIIQRMSFNWVLSVQDALVF